jgi:glycosyltransferase involved in cell wall biosynthesis
VHLETALRLPMAALAERLEARLVLSVHDFALFCPRPHLVEEPAGAFCGYSTDELRCGRCLAPDRDTPEAIAEHRAAAVRLLAASRGVVFPSRFLAEQHRELFPGTAGDWRVIEPGLPATALPALTPGPRRPPRVAFLGGGDPHKGAGAFAELVACAAERGSPIEWWCFGGGDRRGLQRLRRLGVTVRGYYRWGTLPALLRRHGIAAALLLPTVPESFSLALSECRRAGVPVVACRMGALAERVGSADGLLVEPGAGASRVLAAVEEILARPPERESRPAPIAADAASSHLRLYRELAASSEPLPP